MISGLSLNAILTIAAAVGIPGLAWFGWKKVEDYWARKQERDEANDKIKAANKQAQSWADRPRTDSDTLKRLREFADKQ